MSFVLPNGLSPIPPETYNLGLLLAYLHSCILLNVTLFYCIYLINFKLNLTKSYKAFKDAKSHKC